MAETEYPIGADLLILPLQGRSDIADYALSFVDRLMPKMILLDHFDDAFPPISSAVDTAPFVALMAKRHPHIPVISPKAGTEWIDIGDRKVLPESIEKYGCLDIGLSHDEITNRLCGAQQ